MRQPEMAQKAEHRRGSNLHSGPGKPDCSSSNVRSGCLAIQRDPLGILRQSIVLVAAELVRTDATGGAVSPYVAADRTQADPAQFACGPPRAAVPQLAAGHPRTAYLFLLASNPASSLNQTAPRRAEAMWRQADAVNLGLELRSGVHESRLTGTPPTYAKQGSLDAAFRRWVLRAIRSRSCPPDPLTRSRFGRDS